MSDMMDRLDLRMDFVLEKFKTVEIQENGCWKWTGKLKRSRGNYGQLTLYVRDKHPQKRTFAAHRLSYALYNGEDPGEFCVMHTCDNPICVNPDHLKLGTHAENMADMANKRRSTIGETNPKAKLTESSVEAIVRMIEQGRGNSEIAAKLPVSHALVSLIRSGKCWRHVTEKLGYDPEKHKRFNRRAA